MKNKIFKILILTLVLILVFGSVSAFAANPYETYTYSIDGSSEAVCYDLRRPCKRR